MNLRLDLAAVERDFRARAVRGLTAAALTLAGDVKELISVPAPRVLVRSRSGASYYRATTPATPGAPPRKLSGRLRASITYEIAPQALLGRVGTNVIYGRSLERQNHRYLTLCLERGQAKLAREFKRAAEA